MRYYYTENDKGQEIRTEHPVGGVREAREWFIACGVYMAIDPQPVPTDEERRQEALSRVRKAIEEGRVTHSRSRRIGGPVVCVYERDSESPTGVRCLAILDDNEETSRLLGSRFSALSPTEGLRG